MEQTAQRNELKFLNKTMKCSQMLVSQKHFVPSPLKNHDRHTQMYTCGLCGKVLTSVGHL